MPVSKFLRPVISLAFAALILACDLSALLPGGSPRPTVVIQSPAGGANFKEGDEIPVQSTASDPSGVVRVELLVDGQVVSTDAPPIPQGQVSFSLVQKWKATGGSHTLSVRAYNAAGTGSDPAIVAVEIAPAQTALGSPTSSPLSANTPAPIASPPGAQPTNTAGAAAQPTATRRPNTPTPSRAPASPTSSAPPGIYAVSMRIDPSNPRLNTQVSFYVTFLNTTKETIRRRWFVKIYRPDERNSFGETAKADIDLPVGASEFKTPDNWKTSVYADCQPFFARPFWFDIESTLVTEFLKTDGQAVNHGFSVCP